jgi:hypothetical protein
MDADVIVVGPFAVLKEAGALEYDTTFYEGVPDNTLVIGVVVAVSTTTQSRQLAEILNIEPWDLGNHRITSVNEGYDLLEEIGDKPAYRIVSTVRKLLTHPDVLMFYRPNG